MNLLPPKQPRLLARSTWPEAQRLTAALRTETTGGLLLLAAAVLALVWANSPWHESYAALRDLRVGPHALHLDLSLGQWAADGLLAIFFFVAGLELKHELVVGDLRDPRKAAVPVVAALCGVAVPALVYLAVTATRGADAAVLRGWGVPTATDIAFALAVLAVIGTHLPTALRSFLLTLAVVDDLVAIVIIAVVYTSSVDLMALAAAVVPIALFGLAVQKRRTYAWLLVPLAVVAWALVHASGIHATVAGVVLGLLVPVQVSPRYQAPVRRRLERLDDAGALDDDQREHARKVVEASIADRFEHRLRPLSAGVAVPLFAFFSAGVRVVGGGFGAALADPVLLGTALGLVLGKLLGVFGGTWVLARFTRAELDDGLDWADVFGLALLAGVGFTVSLLVGELAFGAGSPHDEHVKMAVLIGSFTAAALASVVLRARNRHYRDLAEADTRDDDGDGIPDAYAR